MAEEPAAPFYPDARYSDAVPTLRQVLGFDHGEQIARPAEIERYFRALSGSSPSALLVEYGRSAEGRPLLYLAISEQANLQRVAEVKEALRRLADPRTCDREAAAALIERTPAVTWVGANVHGGEHSSAEAALLLAYHLLAAEDELAQTIRRESVVVIDPLQNPDGRERSVQYYYSAFGLGMNADQNAAEHHWPWPGPRGNHYLFDLNRDWMLLTQAETPPKVRAFLEWRPQVYCDLHEMGHNSTYYFFPPAPPVNANYPEVTMRWWETYGRAIAACFDREGIDYYTRERFDAFYPGYGESWPSFHGATGMTFEQASVRGLAIRREDDVELTLREALRHHFLAALASCEVTARRRKERLWDHYAFHEDGVLHGQQSEVREYLIPPVPGARRLAENLSQQGIEVRVASEPFRPGQAVDGITGEPFEGELPAGTFLYRLDQPYSRYLQAVMEPRTALPEEFLREELEQDAARMPDRFYDITAWSRPLALGLPLFEARAFSDVPSQPLPEPSQPLPSHPSRSSLTSAPTPNTQPSTPQPAAVLLPYTSAEAAAVAARLQREGFRVHCARRGFHAGGRDYPAGAFVLRRGRNEGAREAVARAREGLEADVEAVEVDTLWTDTGVDLGSEEVVYLKTPRIALLYDWPVSSLSFGWLACLLEQRYRIPFSAVRRDRLGAREFRDYDVLVLPSGDGYAKALDAEQNDWLKTWTRSGGVLVGVGRAAAHLCRPDAGLVGVRVIEDLASVGSGGEGASEETRKRGSEEEGERHGGRETREGQARKRGKEAAGRKVSEGVGAAAGADGEKEPVPYERRPVRVPGAFLRVELDPYHPLTFGYPNPTTVFYDASLLLARGPETRAVAAFAPREQLVVSGFAWERMQEALPGHLWAAEEPCGHGHVVLFAADPAYRAAWDQMHRFLLNALLLMPSVKRPG